MIKVTYYPIDGTDESCEAANLAEWFVDKFGPKLKTPDGLRVTVGSVDVEHDITDDIALGDPDGHLVAQSGEYHVLEIPHANVPIVGEVIKLINQIYSWLVPTPSAPRAPSSNFRQNSSTNSLSDRSNTARPGERYQDVRGFEPAVYADLLMEPHRRYEDNREVEYVYGSATTGRGLVTSPRDGITPLSNIPQAQFDVYGPYTSPNHGDDPAYSLRSKITFPVVAARKSTNVTGQELVPPNVLETQTGAFSANDSGVVTVLNPSEDLDLNAYFVVGDVIELKNWIAWRYVKTELVGPEPGVSVVLYEPVNLSGSYSVTSVATDSFTVDVSGASDWSLFGAAFNLFGTVQQYVTEPQYYSFSVPTGAEEFLTPTTFLPAISGLYDGTIGPYRLPDNTASGWVNLLARSGVYKAGSSNFNYSVTCQFSLHEVTEDGIRTGNILTLDPVVLSSNPALITDQVGSTQDFTNPYYYCEIEGKRVSDTDKNFNGTVVDEVLWSALYTIENGPAAVVLGNRTTVYAKITQNPTAVSIQERKLNFGVTRYERAYLGNGAMSATEDTPSDEFADAVVGLALDPNVGKNVTLSQLNIDDLYSVQEEIAGYFGTRRAVKFGYSFDTSDMTFEEHLKLIATSVFCRVFRIGNTYEFQFDRPRAEGERALLLNHRLKFSGSDKRNRRFNDSSGKRYDGVKVSYKDYKTFAYEDIILPEGSAPTNPFEVQLRGVIYPEVASWYAYRQWNMIRYKRLFHETEAHSLARSLVPGDRITMANDTLTRSQNGQVLGQSGLNLRLSDGVTIQDGVVYSITLLHRSGTVENVLCQSSSNGEKWVQLFALPSEEIYTGNIDRRTAYNLYEASEADRDDMLVESMSVSIKNGQERVKVQAVNYDIRYWSGDPQEVSTGSFSTAFSDAFDKG